MSSQSINIWAYNLKITYTRNNVDILRTFSYTCAIKRLYTIVRLLISKNVHFFILKPVITQLYTRLLYILCSKSKLFQSSIEK